MYWGGKKIGNLNLESMRRNNDNIQRIELM